MVLITIVTGVYKPTYNWGAPHCAFVYIGEGIHLYMETMFFSAFFFQPHERLFMHQGSDPSYIVHYIQHTSQIAQF